MDLGIGEIIKAGANAGPIASLGDAWQALVGDRVAHWRIRNAINLQVRTNEEVRRLGLKVDNSRIPERYAIAWFEEATKQDEPELQTLFARLLARAAAGDNDAGDRRLIKVLANLTPVDAAIFQRIYSDTPFPDTGPYSQTCSITSPATMDRRVVGWPRDWASGLIEHFHPGHARKSIEHLIVNGILEDRVHIEGDRNGVTLQPPTAERSRRTSWRKFVQSHAALRNYILPSELGRSLYDATKI